MLDGVEWNVRLAQASTPDLIEKFKAAFESYWADPDYEAVRSSPRRRAVRSRDSPNRRQRNPLTSSISICSRGRFSARCCSASRPSESGIDRHRNLVVAATGTGKTLVAAFDYQAAAGAAFRIQACCLSPTGARSFHRAWGPIEPFFEMVPSASCSSTVIVQSTAGTCLRRFSLWHRSISSDIAAGRVRRGRRRRVPSRRGADVRTAA